MDVLTAEVDVLQLRWMVDVFTAEVDGGCVYS